MCLEEAALFGLFGRDEQVIPFEGAIRRLTSLPADNLRLEGRGRLQPGALADVVVLDPASIQDRATYENPQRYSEGVVHIWVNGEQVLKNGEHIGALPGRVVRGPGWKGD